MNLFQKIFKVIQSFLHAFVNKIQDPILMAEQAIRDLKKDYDASMRNLAEIKSLSIDTKNKVVWINVAAIEETWMDLDTILERIRNVQRIKDIKDSHSQNERKKINGIVLHTFSNSFDGHAK